MDKSFLNWYTQSLGGIIGLIACMIAYLNGDMVVYGRIFRNIDSIGFFGVIASIVLIPLCIIITFLGFLEPYIENEKLLHINKSIVFLTSIIGIIGSKLYFIIPSIFILFKYYSNLTTNKNEENSEVHLNSKVIKTNCVKKRKNNKNNKELIKIKIDIAVELLLKGADKNFICEITGFSKQEVEYIEQRIK